MDGEWVGQYGAYTPWAGGWMVASSMYLHLGPVMCAARGMHAVSCMSVGLPVFSVNGAGVQAVSLPRSGHMRTHARTRAHTHAGLPEPAWLDAKGRYINVVYTRAREHRGKAVADVAADDVGPSGSGGGAAGDVAAAEEDVLMRKIGR